MEPVSTQELIKLEASLLLKKESIPKLKRSSLNREDGIINWASDHKVFQKFRFIWE